MLNEFYEFIAKKVNSFFQKAASDGTLLKGESFCLKLDNDDMVAKVSSALKHLAEENKITANQKTILNAFGLDANHIKYYASELSKELKKAE